MRRLHTLTFEFPTPRNSFDFFVIHCRSVDYSHSFLICFIALTHYFPWWLLQGVQQFLYFYFFFVFACYKVHFISFVFVTVIFHCDGVSNLYCISWRNPATMSSSDFQLVGSERFVTKVQILSCVLISGRIYFISAETSISSQFAVEIQHREFQVCLI